MPIRYNYDDIRATSQILNALVTDFAVAYKNMASNIEWEGAASEAYVAKFDELRPAFTDAQNLLEDIAKALENTATAVETTDNEIASKFNA